MSETVLPLTEAEIEEMRAERDRVGTHTAESLRIVDRNARAADEVDRLRSLCAQMYQVAGALLFEYEGDFGVEVLDNLSDAAGGNPLRHETLLPFVLPENRAKQPKDDECRCSTAACSHADTETCKACGCTTPFDANHSSIRAAIAEREREQALHEVSD